MEYFLRWVLLAVICWGLLVWEKLTCSLVLTGKLKSHKHPFYLDHTQKQIADCQLGTKWSPALGRWWSASESAPLLLLSSTGSSSSRWTHICTSPWELFRSRQINFCQQRKRLLGISKGFDVSILPICFMCCLKIQPRTLTWSELQHFQGVRGLHLAWFTARELGLG